ncbi:hypothetical protein BOX15_Mlig028412g4, partial [Macrostomum lignano]
TAGMSAPASSSQGGDKIKYYLDQRLTESRNELDRSYCNLGNVAKFCKENYLSAPDRQAALEKTMHYTTQALASVAYQVNVVSADFIQLLDLQNRELGRLTAEVGVLDTKVRVHKERIARRHIGQLTSNRPAAQVAAMRHPGIVYHDGPAGPLDIKMAKYIRRPIDFDSLDDVGHGPAAGLGLSAGGGDSTSQSMSRQSSSNTSAAAAAAAIASSAAEDYQNRASSYSSASGVYAAAAVQQMQQQQQQQKQRGGVGNYGTLPSKHHQQQQQPHVPPLGIAKPIMQQQQQQPPTSQQHRNSYGYSFPAPLGPTDASPPPPPLLSNGSGSNGGSGYYGHQQQQQQHYMHHQHQQQLSSPESLPPPPPPEDFHHNQQPAYQQFQQQPTGVDISNLLPQATDQLVARRHDDPDWAPQLYIQRVLAIYEYTADKDDELTFRENDVIYVVKKNDDGWWEGYMAGGVSGLFPGNYVE